MDRPASLWRRFLHRIAGFRPLNIIHAEVLNHDGEIIAEYEPLFERYFLFELPAWLGGGVAYLHHYLRSDPARGMHDHPWGWAVSIPLAAGYHEERLTGFNLCGPVAVVRRRPRLVPYRLSGGDFHRVIVSERTTSWSLFIHGPFSKPWGFLRPVPDGTVNPPTERESSQRMTVGYPYRYVSTAGTMNPPTTPWWTHKPSGRQVERAPA